MSGSGVGSGVDLRAPADAPLVRSVVRCPEFARRVLLALVTLTAVGCVVGCLAIIRADDASSGLRWPFWLAVASVCAAQFARVRVRVAYGYVFVGWGEVATIMALCLVPPVWAPLACVLGAAIAHIDRLVSTPAGQRLRIPFAICALTIGTTASAATATPFAGGATQQLRPGSMASLAGLILAALVYSGISSLLVAVWVSEGSGIGLAWRQTVRGKRFMLPGNLAIGTAVAVFFAIDPRWLLALIPIFALLHRAYLHRARADERWDWWEENLVAVSRGLSLQDPPAVAAAALRGARALFGAAEVQVALRHEPAAAASEPWIWYELRGTDDAEVVVATADAPLRGSAVVSRPLVVGDTTLGEMRMRFDRSKRLDQPTDLVFATYAYAVANALSDAATHHNLQVMAARTAFDAVHDPLTGLTNRSMLVARGDAELARRPVGAPAALILLDVDSFREVNDTLGPAAGDELLQTIAARLDGSTQPGEVLARLSGDEFGLLLTQETAAVEAADRRAKEVASLVASPAEVAGVMIAVTATVGVGLGCVGGHGGELIGRVVGVDTTELMRRAGVALRRARREGVAVASYADVLVPDAAKGDRHTMLADLRDALATSGQLCVVVQPVVSLVTGGPVGAEVLIRWHHPTRGLLMPTDFLEAVEGSELATGVTRYVIDKALEIAATWSGQGIDLPVTVNLCARCTLDPQLPALVFDRLQAHEVAAERLILEITEAVMVADPERVEQSVGALRTLGVQVSVGDFGTASASLELLTRCRVDEVKIDRTFVAAMTTSPETAAIVNATVKMARELGIRVVAEAVELTEQRDALTALGVRNAQGHLFYPPLAPAEATELVSRSVTSAP